jgi:hypothetical protein
MFTQNADCMHLFGGFLASVFLPIFDAQSLYFSAFLYNANSIIFENTKLFLFIICSTDKKVERSFIFYRCKR